MTHARKKEEYTDCRECRRVVIAKDDAMHALWVQAGRVVDRTLVWVAAHEAASDGVVPARAEVVEAEIRIVALAAVEIGVRRGARARDQVAEGVVGVGVGERPTGGRSSALICSRETSVGGQKLSARIFSSKCAGNLTLNASI